MPSKDSKTPGKDDAKVVKFKANEESRKNVAKKTGGITLTKIVTYVILGLLAIVLVVGVFPSFGTGGQSSSIRFGSYDGNPIEFSFGNYFYRQYQNQAQQNRSGGESASYQIWRSAFESTVFHTALTNMAEAVGIRVAEPTLNRAIIDSGAYHRDGKFDVSVYEQASLESRNQLKTQYQENLPVQMVMEDISTVLTAPGEFSYIVELGDSARSFSYVVFDHEAYPDALAQEYAQNHPSLFTLIDISVITVGDRVQAEELRSAIVAGETTFEDAARMNSLDSFSAEGGRAGTWYLYELQGNFSNPEEVNALFSAQEGEITQAFDAPGGAVLYRVEGSPFLPDFADTEVLADVKTYIGTHETELIASYVEQEAQEFTNLVATEGDFDRAAQRAGVSVISVDATPINVGGSSYLTGFSYTDPRGHLNNLSSDTDAMRTLYTIPVGSVSDPIEADGRFIVAQVTGETGMDAEMREYLELVYPYMSQSQSQQDMIQAVFTSDKLQDNFLMTYMEEIMGIGSN
jgi:parvulin-like peptidyl-prolyl isomerase